MSGKEYYEMFHAAEDRREEMARHPKDNESLFIVIGIALIVIPFIVAFCS